MGFPTSFVLEDVSKRCIALFKLLRRIAEVHGIES